MCDWRMAASLDRPSITFLLAKDIMKRDLPDFKTRTANEHARLGTEGAIRLLDAGRAWNLAPALQAGGAVIFPHTSLEVCGHQIAAAVHACLDSGAERVLVIGVLHALTQELEQARVRVATADPFHHGIGYGDPPEKSLAPEDGGLELARMCIEEGLELLQAGDYWGYNQHCVDVKSDARDAGQVLRYLLGPLEGHILDIVSDDMTGPYQKPAPTWVAGALIELLPVPA